MNKIIGIVLALCVMLSAAMGMMSVSAEGAETGRFVKTPGRFTTIVGATDQVIVGARVIGGKLMFGAVGFDGRVISNFSNTWAAIMDDCNKYVLYDGNKATVYSADGSFIYNIPQYFGVPIYCTENVALMFNSETNKYHYVNLGSESYNYFEIDASEEDLTFNVFPFIEGKACYRINNAVFSLSINAAGEFVKTGFSLDGSVCNYNLSSPYAGYAVITKFDNNTDEFTGALLLKCSDMSYTEIAENALDDMAYYQTDYGIVNNYSSMLFALNETEDKITFADGLNYSEPEVFYDDIYFSRKNEKYMNIEDNGVCKFIDKSGNIYGNYLDASTFYNGISVVTDESGTYMIDDNFNQISKPQKLRNDSFFTVTDKVYGANSSDSSKTAYVYITDPDFHIIGDADCSDDLTVSDVVVMRKDIMNSAEKKSWCDLDGNGTTTVSDIVELRRLIMNS